jgi:tRNA 2-thiouridine synthesizing protein A
MLKLAKKVDARGLSCPKPVLITKEELEKNPNQLHVLVDNGAACMNVKRYMESAGYKVSISDLDDGEFEVSCKK